MITLRGDEIDMISREISFSIKELLDKYWSAVSLVKLTENQKHLGSFLLYDMDQETIP